jgi:RNA polymerase sigma-70 factor (ECF subfamily)
MSPDLMQEARAGDGDAFAALTRPYRRELRLHCYRLLGSVQDAEDALQETLLAAWQGLSGFEGRASLRTWLYQIATHRCLNLRRTASRRPALAWNVPGVPLIEPTRLGEITWLEPWPDDAVDSLPEHAPGPEARYEQAQSISLAFVAALQSLPPRQLAVLVLRDVLEFQAEEVATMIDASLDSVNSALKRARAAMQRRQASTGAPRERPPSADSAQERALVDRFVRAYEAADLDALVALFTDDVFVAMPPMAYEYVGLELARRFCGAILNGRRFTLRPTRANGQPAFGTYLQLPNGQRRGTGMLVLGLSGDRVCAVTRFEAGLMPRFGLPAQLDAPAA